MAFGFLGMGPVTIAVDSYGPVTDNAQSIYELSRIEDIDGIDEANIHAEFKDGVLQVKLPKAAGEPQRKQIEIH